MNRRVVVVGGSGFIGTAISERFAQGGDHVVVGSATRPDSAEALAKRLTDVGLRASAVQGDVSDAAGADDFIARSVGELGGVDVLINCAGLTVGGGEFGKLSDDDWLAAIRANLLTAVHASQAALPHLRQSKGRVINITSVRGLEHVGRTSIMAYSAAKASLISFTKTLAKDLAPEVLVNAIAPGFVYTPNYDTMAPELKAAFIGATPLADWIPAEEIAKTAVFLADSNAITAQTLIVDGGFSLKLE